jgi:hypothetical protein
MVLPPPESCPFASREQLAEIDRCTFEEIEDKLISMAEAGAIVPVGVYDLATGEPIDIRFHLQPSVAEHERQDDAWFRCYFPCFTCEPPGRPRPNHFACEEALGSRGQTAALIYLEDGRLRPVCRFCLDLHASLLKELPH